MTAPIKYLSRAAMCRQALGISVGKSKGNREDGGYAVVTMHRECEAGGKRGNIKI